MATMPPSKDELVEALDFLRTANSQSNTKGKAVKEWFEANFEATAAVSFIKAGNQIGNRLKEQKGKLAPYTVFFFEDDTLIRRTSGKISEYIYSELLAVFYILFDGTSYRLVAMHRRYDSDLAVETLNNLIGDEDTAVDLLGPRAEASAQASKVGKNLLFYGAPGVGKSYTVNTYVGSVNVERTVFHPDTQNSDFFGCLKPRSHLDTDGKNVVLYEFAPGPFSKALKAALQDPKHHHYLVIEELNRAPAAAVFGELFQLLDREDDGASTYSIAFPNPESEMWMNAEVGPAISKLYIPSNLSIVATMNSADQGVYPLDTAFRRRLEQEYLALYGVKFPEGSVEFVGSDGNPWLVPWIDFIKFLNNWLLDKLDVSEDRLLGQWFVKSRELGGSVPSKILLYLWDDLLRHHGREFFFDVDSLRTFGELNGALIEGRPIFAHGFLEELERSPSSHLLDRENGEAKDEEDA